MKKTVFELVAGKDKEVKYHRLRQEDSPTPMSGGSFDPYLGRSLNKPSTLYDPHRSTSSNTTRDKYTSSTNTATNRCYMSGSAVNDKYNNTATNKCYMSTSSTSDKYNNTATNKGYMSTSSTNDKSNKGAVNKGYVADKYASSTNKY